MQRNPFSKHLLDAHPTAYSCVQRKCARLALFSSRETNLSQFPIFWSRLSTFLLIPLPFAPFLFARVPPLMQLSKYRSNTISTLVHLSEKCERTYDWNLSHHSPNVVDYPRFPSACTEAIPSMMVHVSSTSVGRLCVVFSCSI